MTDILRRLIHWIDLINGLIGKGVAWLTPVMVLVMFSVVILRYAFSLGWIAMQESVTYLHATIFMLGAAHTLRQEGHVRVDIFYQRFGERGKAWVDLFGTLLLLLPVSSFILWSSWDFVADSWHILEKSQEGDLGLPLVYLLKSLIPAMALLLILQGIANLLRQLLILTNNQSSASP